MKFTNIEKSIILTGLFLVFAEAFFRHFSNKNNENADLEKQLKRAELEERYEDCAVIYQKLKKLEKTK